MKRALDVDCSSISREQASSGVSLARLLPELWRQLDAQINAPDFHCVRSFLAWYGCCRYNLRRSPENYLAHLARLLAAKCEHLERRMSTTRAGQASCLYRHWSLLRQCQTHTELRARLVQRMSGAAGLLLDAFKQSSPTADPIACAYHLCPLDKEQDLLEFFNGRITPYGLDMLSRARLWFLHRFGWCLVLAGSDGARMAFPWRATDYKPGAHLCISLTP